MLTIYITLKINQLTELNKREAALPDCSLE